MPPCETIHVWHCLTLQLCHGLPMSCGSGRVGNMAKVLCPSSSQEESLSINICLGGPPSCQISNFSSPPILCYGYAAPWLIIAPLNTSMRHRPKLHPEGSKVLKSIVNFSPYRIFRSTMPYPCQHPLQRICGKSVTTWRL